jgi:hypothetical protein
MKTSPRLRTVQPLLHSNPECISMSHSFNSKLHKVQNLLQDYFIKLRQTQNWEREKLGRRGDDKMGWEDWKGKLRCFFFSFWTMHLLRVNEKPTNASTIQCIGTQYSTKCFGILKCHNKGVKHDPAATGVQCRGKQRRMELYVVTGGVMVGIPRNM